MTSSRTSKSARPRQAPDRAPSSPSPGDYDRIQVVVEISCLTFAGFGHGFFSRSIKENVDTSGRPAARRQPHPCPYSVNSSRNGRTGIEVASDNDSFHITGNNLIPVMWKKPGRADRLQQMLGDLDQVPGFIPR